MIDISNCPICDSSAFTKLGEAQDHTVSNESFAICQCNSCGFRITSPRPTDEHLGRYYLSPSYISHASKATSTFDKLYSISREFALCWKLTLVKKFSNATGSLLDFGCGTGFFLKKMKDGGFQIQGVELSSVARETAEKITGTKIAAKIEDVNGKFDVITLWHVLEHVSLLNETLTKLIARLEKNGTLIIAVPNYNSFDGKKYGFNWAGYDVPRHLWHFEQKTMKLLLERHQMKLIGTIPMKLDALYVSMLSEKNLAGKQTIKTFLKGLYQGLWSNLNAKQKNYSSIIYIARQE